MSLVLRAEDVATFKLSYLNCLSCNTLGLCLRGAYVWVVYSLIVCAQPVSVKVGFYVEAWASWAKGVGGAKLGMSSVLCPNSP